MLHSSVEAVAANKAAIIRDNQNIRCDYPFKRTGGLDDAAKFAFATAKIPTTKNWWNCGCCWAVLQVQDYLDFRDLLSSWWWGPGDGSWVTRECPQAQGNDESASGSWSPAGIQQFHYLLLKKCDRLGIVSEPGEPHWCSKKDRCVDECFSWGTMVGIGVHVRSILSNIGVVVLPDQKAIGSAYQAFDENENLKDESQQAAIMQLGSKLAIVIAKLNTWLLTHHRDTKFGCSDLLPNRLIANSFSTCL